MKMMDASPSSSSGTLWNLSSHDSVKMEIVDHALHALSDEVMVPHSGWERGRDGGEESLKPRHLEWETALTNTAGCLRHVNGEGLEISGGDEGIAIGSEGNINHFNVFFFFFLVQERELRT